MGPYRTNSVKPCITRKQRWGGVGVGFVCGGPVVLDTDHLIRTILPPITLFPLLRSSGPGPNPSKVVYVILRSRVPVCLPSAPGLDPPRPTPPVFHSGFVFPSLCLWLYPTVNPHVPVPWARSLNGDYSVTLTTPPWAYVPICPTVGIRSGYDRLYSRWSIHTDKFKFNWF